jgi:hypothetical protein
VTLSWRLSISQRGSSKRHLTAYEAIAESRWALNAYFDYYNCERRHQSLDRRTPYEVYWGTKIDLKKIDYSGDKFKYIPFNPGDQKYQDITDQAK